MLDLLDAAADESTALDVEALLDALDKGTVDAAMPQLRAMLAAGDSNALGAKEKAQEKAPYARQPAATPGAERANYHRTI